MTFAERSLLRALRLKYNNRNVTNGYAMVYNTRKNYPNLNRYRALEKAGHITIDSVSNATTENMLYGMSHITFTLKGK